MKNKLTEVIYQGKKHVHYSVFDDPVKFPFHVFIWRKENGVMTMKKVLRSATQKIED